MKNIAQAYDLVLRYNFPIPDFIAEEHGFTQSELQAVRYQHIYNLLGSLGVPGKEQTKDLVEYLYQYTFTRNKPIDVSRVPGSKPPTYYQSFLRNHSLKRVPLHEWVKTEVDLLIRLLTNASGHWKDRLKLVTTYLPHRTEHVIIEFLNSELQAYGFKSLYATADIELALKLYDECGSVYQVRQGLLEVTGCKVTIGAIKSVLIAHGRDLLPAPESWIKSNISSYSTVDELYAGYCENFNPIKFDSFLGKCRKLGYFNYSRLKNDDKLYLLDTRVPLNQRLARYSYLPIEYDRLVSGKWLKPFLPAERTYRIMHGDSEEAFRGFEAQFGANRPHRTYADYVKEVK